MQYSNSMHHPTGKIFLLDINQKRESFGNIYLSSPESFFFTQKLYLSFPESLFEIPRIFIWNPESLFELSRIVFINYLYNLSEDSPHIFGRTVSCLQKLRFKWFQWVGGFGEWSRDKWGLAHSRERRRRRRRRRGTSSHQWQLISGTLLFTLIHRGFYVFLLFLS